MGIFVVEIRLKYGDTSVVVQSTEVAAEGLRIFSKLLLKELK